MGMVCFYSPWGILTPNFILVNGENIGFKNNGGNILLIHKPDPHRGPCYVLACALHMIMLKKAQHHIFSPRPLNTYKIPPNPSPQSLPLFFLAPEPLVATHLKESRSPHRGSASCVIAHRHLMNSPIFTSKQQGAKPRNERSRELSYGCHSILMLSCNHKLDVDLLLVTWRNFNL